MKYLVLGAAGMAGHTISIYLKERGHDVTGFARRAFPFVNCITGDARDRELIKRIINDGEFDIVINAIGILNKAADKNESDAVYLNGEFPHVLASLVEGLPTRVFHMSTDCVFAGNTGPYDEDSEPDGKTVYDRTKALGELHDDKNLTFRNSIIGPDMNQNGIGLFNWFMKQDGPIKGYTGAVWTGLTTLELAKAMEHEAQGYSTGLVNMVPGYSITKYELLLLFNKYLRGEKIQIDRDDEFQLDKTLVRTNFESTFTPAGYEKQVCDMAEWIRAHSSLYPHYRIEA